MNPFAVLGIEETADDEQVRAAYLAAVRRSPPDRDPEGFRRVREAYEHDLAADILEVVEAR